MKQFLTLLLVALTFLSAAPQAQNAQPGIMSWLWASNQPYIRNKTTNTLTNPVTFETTTTQKSVSCKPTQTNYNGKCFEVLQPFPCPDGQWVIEDEKTQQGKCVENKCANFGLAAYFKGNCVDIRSDDLCPEGMKTYIYKSGAVDCDCKEGFIYHEKDERCYEAYRQGPCRPGEVLGIDSNGNAASKSKCISNPCLTDGYFYSGPKCQIKTKKNSFWTFFYPKPKPSYCFKFGSPCSVDDKGVFVIHPETNQPYCQLELNGAIIGRPNTRIIGNVPTLKCAPGSRRDILGNCRTPTIIEFS